MDITAPISRRKRVYYGKELVSTTYRDVTWEEIRKLRSEALQRTDWWALKDLTLTAARKAYRAFLRDMPQNFEAANDAADAWEAYEIPQ